jgi:hypothetical protein
MSVNTPIDGSEIMRMSSLVLGLVFLILAVVIFIFADGPRRFYSGGFFLILAVFLLVSSRKRAADAESETTSAEDH